MRTRTLFLMMALAVVVHAQSYSIKGPSSPKPYESNAAKELGDYLAKRIDGTLSVGGKTPVVFHVGDTELAKAKGLLSSQLKDEQWIIKSFDNNVILNGGGTRGALYAVYHFLEDYCDIHWWSEFEEYMPKPSSLSLPALDAKGKPAFLYRDIYCYGWKDTLHPKYMPFAIRNRLNRAGDKKVVAAFGGAFDYGPPDHCHTFEQYFPEDKYFNEHPEYFSLLDGKRVGGAHSQLCLTNPQVKRIFLEKLLEYIKQGDEEAAKRDVAPPRIYDVSMNDCRNSFCECPECKAEIDKYGYSGYMLRFVNFMAENIARTRPEIYISTLAYHVCDKPPRGGVRANDNVIVKLCDTITNQSASILEEDNRKFRESLSEWNNFAKNLFIWDYAITFVGANTGIPFASEFHYGDLFRFYHEHNVKGVFWEHERMDRADCYELKIFLEMKLMEDPYQDVNKLMYLFLSRYYGAAAPHILKVRQKLDKARKANKGYITYFSGYSTFAYITNDLIQELQKLFDEAETSVKDDATLLLRVRRARMGLDNITARRFRKVIYHGSNWKPSTGGVSADDAASRFFKTYDEWTEKFAERKGLRNNIRAFHPSFNKRIEAAPVPKELEGRSFFDCYPVHFANESPSYIETVADTESPVGEAMRMDVSRSHHLNMPFAVGVYDEGNEKTLAEPKFNKIPDGAGYHWFKVPALLMPENGYAFVSRAWTIQLPFVDPYISGKRFEVWVSAKHVGKQFHAGQGKPEYIYVDRIVFVESEEKK